MLYDPFNFEKIGTASNFASWVYQRFHRGAGLNNSKRRKERMQLGQAVHADIERLRLWAIQNIPTPNKFRNWHLVFADSPKDCQDRIFLASKLQFEGKPMKCKPDLVLREMDTGKIIIVERKVTTPEHLERLTEWGYARIRAQLWCYAWIAIGLMQMMYCLYVSGGLTIGAHKFGHIGYVLESVDTSGILFRTN